MLSGLKSLIRGGKPLAMLEEAEWFYLYVLVEGKRTAKGIALIALYSADRGLMSCPEGAEWGWCVYTRQATHPPRYAPSLKREVFFN